MQRTGGKPRIDMTRNNVNPRLTVEELAVDCLNVSDLNKAGALKGGWVTIRVGIRWPAIRKMMASSLLEPFPERPRGMHQKTYDRLKTRAQNLEIDLPPKGRGKAVDYKNLIYYLP